ncbi:hypothetical protein MASR2M16_18350 [Thauera terpenica]
MPGDIGVRPCHGSGKVLRFRGHAVTTQQRIGLIEQVIGALELRVGIGIGIGMQGGQSFIAPP